MNRAYVLLLPLRILLSLRRASKRAPATFSRELKRRFLFWAAALIGLRHVLWLTRRETVPYTRRQHQILMPQVVERLFGSMIFKLIKQIGVESRITLPDSHRHVKLVKRIGTKIAKAATELHHEGSCGHMQGLSWEFLVVKTNLLNACVYPGGKVVVLSGLIEMLNKDELAAVLAHEVAHVVARHHVGTKLQVCLCQESHLQAERVAERGIISVARLTVHVLCNVGLPPDLAEVFVHLPHSRRAETEADIIGIRLMAKAGFNPAAAVSMFRKFEARELLSGGSGVPPILRTHPVTSDRIECMQRELPEAMALFNRGGPLPNLWRRINPLRWLRP